MHIDRQESQRVTKEPISVNDMVIVHDENGPQGFWKLGKVEKLYTGSDQESRDVQQSGCCSGKGTVVIN